MRLLPRLRLGCDLARDRAGMAVVEFALLMPILLTLCLASYEAANLILADLKLQAAAETATDLVAQTTVSQVLASADFTNVSNAVEAVMAPFPTTASKFGIAYASVTYNTGSPVIDWHFEVNGATAITVATLPNGANAANLGSATSGSTDSFIVARVTYAYTSSLSYLLNSAYTLTEAAYNRPRYMNCVPVNISSPYNTGVCP